MRASAIWKKFSGLSRAARDALVIAATVGSFFAASAYLDLFERFHHFADNHEAWELDEIIVSSLLLGFACLLFAIRRLFDLRTARSRAERLARQDSLTELPNRRCFLEELDSWSARLIANETCAVFLIDLDNFKPVNDLYGHRLGDEVLRVAAQRLKHVVGDRALVARIGGDEFGIIMPVAVDFEAPLKVAGCIIDEMSKSIRLASLSIGVGASMGIAVLTADAEQPAEPRAPDGSPSEAVMHRADMALYQAKRMGPNSYCIFNEELEERFQQRVELERDIRPAIQAGQIIPYYQPLVELVSGAVTGCEVLARWEHPRLGLLPAATLIPIAQSTGSLSELTFSLLEQAIRDAEAWPGELSISVNLCPSQFADAWLPEKVLRTLAQNSFPPHRLEFEVTETTLIDQVDMARVTLQSLRNLGIGIALDDFGGGYAGLSYLRQFKLDRVKIDRSFVTDMLSNPNEEKIVEAIVNFGRAFGLQTTAEGIESFEVAGRLIELGCNTGQGYYFCKPKPQAEILRHLNSVSLGLRQAS